MTLSWHCDDSTVLYSIVQYCTVLYSIVQYCIVLCSTVQYRTVQYSTVQYSTVQYSAVQYSKVQCSTVQYSTVGYDVLVSLKAFTPEARAPIYDDEELMQLLTHESDQIREQAVKGLGAESVLTEADLCHERGRYLDAATLAFACGGARPELGAS